MRKKFKIPFNKVFINDEDSNTVDAVLKNKAIGQQTYTKRCETFFKTKYGFDQAFLTPTCTDALEMAALLINIREGDEVIMASYGYVSTANAFMLRGAKIIFIDSSSTNPNIDVTAIEEQINLRTRAIVVTHYGGIACEMDRLVELAKKHEVFLIEDAAHAIDASYNKQFLGSFGDISTFSFHHTKNITCGQGGLIVINNNELVERSKIIRERGTNRTEFLQGNIKNYTWHDIGSAFRLSELSAALLYSQLINIDFIQKKRMKLWNLYWEKLSPSCKAGHIILPFIEENCEHNAHLFFFSLASTIRRNSFIEFMSDRGIQCVSHYISLHSSPFYNGQHDGRILKNADFYTDFLIRLPLYPDLTLTEAEFICDSTVSFFNRDKNRIPSGIPFQLQ
jgi:dTDP-4-amino-4,6-dideoxygalactose transaminase